MENIPPVTGSDTLVTKDNYSTVLTPLKRLNKGRQAHALIDDVDATLRYYFEHHTEPLLKKTIRALTYDYLKAKHDKPDFDPPEGVEYLTKRLYELDKQHKGQPFKKPFRDYSEDEVRNVILNLEPPRHHTQAGIHFLLLLLEEKGVDGVADFMDEASEILDHEGKLLDYDFKGDNQNIVKRARIGKLMHRRTFLETSAWGIGGTICLINGGLQVASLALKTINGMMKESEESKHNTGAHRHDELEWMEHKLEAIKERSENNLGPIENIVIGAALVYEDIKESREKKYEQISNAVAELADFIRKETLVPQVEQGRATLARRH